VTGARVLAHPQVVEYQRRVARESHFLRHTSRAFGFEHADGETAKPGDVFRPWPELSHRLKPVLRTASEGRPYKSDPRRDNRRERRRNVAALEGDVFVGDFWAGGAGGESVVGVPGLIVVFGVSAATCSSAGGHAAAFAASA
jgi:hypothetical protein